MTEKQSKLWGQIVNLNWEASKEINNVTKQIKLIKKLGKKQAELKTSMGEAKYCKFLDEASKMFVDNLL